MVAQGTAQSGAKLALGAKDIVQKNKTPSSLKLDPKASGIEKNLFKFIFGTEEVTGLAQDVAGIELAAKPIIGDRVSKALTGPILVGLTALDFTTGGGKTAVVERLLKSKTISEVAPILRKMGLADDVIQTYAPKFAISQDRKAIEAGLESLEKLSKTSYVPVAQRQATKSAPGEAIVPKVENSFNVFDSNKNLLGKVEAKDFYYAEDKAKATFGDKYSHLMKDTSIVPKVEMVTVYHASPNLPTDGNWRKGTMFADTEQNARYYAESHHTGDIQVQKVEIPKSLVEKNKSNNIYNLKEEYPVIKQVDNTSSPLAQEARKYKSAEEFVKAQQGDEVMKVLNTPDEIKMLKEREGEYEFFKKIATGNRIEENVRAENLINEVKKGKNILATAENSKYKLFITDERPIDSVTGKLLNDERRTILIQNKKTGEIVPEMKWMGEYEKGFGIPESEWEKLPIGEKAKLEAQFKIENFYEGDNSFRVRKENWDEYQTKFKPIKSQLTDLYNQATKGANKATSQTIEGIKPQVKQATQTIPAQTTPTKGFGAEVPSPQLLPQLDKTLPYTVPQQSKVVNRTEVDKKLADSVYESNRAVSIQKGTRLQNIVRGIKEGPKGFGQGMDKLLGTISTRLKNIDPSLKMAIRNFEYKLGQSIQKDRRAVEGFLKKTRDISLEDYADLDLALKNGDVTKTNELLKKYGLEKEFTEVRKTLDDLHKRAEEVGFDIGYEKNYFPRMIKDSEGFLEYLGKGDDWSIIDEAIKAKETAIGRYLTQDEKASLVNTMVRGYKQGISLSETGAMKARTVDIVDANLNQFYRDSVDSLIKYVDSTNDAIEARRFFGKGKKTDQFANVDDSIGSYILDLVAKGKVKPSQEKELRNILQARFGAVGTSGVVRVYKNLSYIDTMGSFTSAITQLGDLAFAIYKGGPINTLKSLGKAIVGKSKITRADLGIEKIAQEFEDASRSALAVNKVFKLIGLEKFDALGKETVINAVISKYQKLAQNPNPELMRRLQAVFGDDTAQVIADLKAGKTTEDVKLLAFNELLDIQPVALSEMPEQYLKGGNGRIFYMLKTYTVKLFDVYRNEVFQVIKKDPVRGIRNMLYLSAALVAMNATADEIKDLMLGRKTSLKDRTVDNILKLAGFSKFTIYKARQEGIGSAVAKTILPPLKFIDSAYKDISKGTEVSQAETIQSIPIGGKLYYWWFGKGRTNTDKKEKSSSSIPSLPQLPKLPKLPKIEI